MIEAVININNAVDKRPTIPDHCPPEAISIMKRYCNTLQQTATHCNTHCNTLQYTDYCTSEAIDIVERYCNTLQ